MTFNGNAKQPCGAQAKAARVVPDVHPRILERRQLIAFAAGRGEILAHLDQLIDSLKHLVPLTGRFSVQADTTRDLRDQLVSVETANPACLVLLDQIQQHMADLTATLAAVARETRYYRQS
jgi:hypothetical protein